MTQGVGTNTPVGRGEVCSKTERKTDKQADKAIITEYREGLLKEECKLKEKKNSKKPFELDTKLKSIKKENRLSFLISKLKLNEPNISMKALVTAREHWDKVKNSRFPIHKSPCYLCEGKAKLRHHIVPLVKGGQTRRNNLVPLCNPCHCKVHPHMREKVADKEVEVIVVKIGKKRKKIKIKTSQLAPKVNFASPFCKPKRAIVVIPPKEIKKV
jgi:hypothetical protein